MTARVKLHLQIYLVIIPSNKIQKVINYLYNMQTCRNKVFLRSAIVNSIGHMFVKRLN